MAGQFSFSFRGDDIEEDDGTLSAPVVSSTSVARENVAASPPPRPSAVTAAFPVQGKPQLPPARHSLDDMLATLPSKIAFGMLHVDLDGNGIVRIPRRELWDVRMQLMAEEGDESGGELQPGLGKHDVKTGIYEGGFKSWESSVDLVRVLAAEGIPQRLGEGAWDLVELGCGTALPSVAMFQWFLAARQTGGQKSPFTLVLADYNPAVLHLVTLPNLLIAWALWQGANGDPKLQLALSSESELQLTVEVMRAFKACLSSRQITLSFLSGGWSAAFVDLLYQTRSLAARPSASSSLGPAERSRSLVIGAETIYSPFALNSFTETLLAILGREQRGRVNGEAAAVVAAKRVYFGVGGSLDDFVDKMRQSGATADLLREETEGVRRGVVICTLAGLGRAADP